MKFGGPVLRDNSGFERMARIVKEYHAEPLLLVVSAFSTATRDIEQAMRRALEGKEVEAKNVLVGIMDHHRNFSRNLLNNPETRMALDVLLDETENVLGNIVRGVTITRELTPRTLDVALSYGEYCAVHIVRHYLQEQGLVVSFADATELIITNDDHLAAIPQYEETKRNVREKLAPLLQPGKIALTQGFVGRTTSGEISTMGRESSNFTAALLAELTGASEVIIWTDVAGIRSADPKHVHNTRLIPRLSYAQAFIAACNGVKPLDPAMIEPVRRAGISLAFRSAFEPDADCTTIISEQPGAPLPILSVIHDVVLVTLQFTTTNGLQQKRHIAADLFPRPETVLSITLRNNTLNIVAHRSSLPQHLPEMPEHCVMSLHEGYDALLLLNLPPEQLAQATSFCMEALNTTNSNNYRTLTEFSAAGSIIWVCTTQSGTSNLLHQIHNRLMEQMAL